GRRRTGRGPRAARGAAGDSSCAGRPCSRVLEAIVAAHANAPQACSVQRAPWNIGRWRSMYRRQPRVLPEGRDLSYVGRAEAASPATGSYKVHQAEERDLVMNAFAR